MAVQTSLGQFKSGTLSALDPATGTASVCFDDGATESEIILSRISISTPRAVNTTTTDIDPKAMAPSFSILPISSPATVLHTARQAHDQQRKMQQSESGNGGVGDALSTLSSMSKQERALMVFLPLVVFPAVVVLLAVSLSFVYAAK